MDDGDRVRAAVDGEEGSDRDPVKDEPEPDPDVYDDPEAELEV